MNPFSDVNVYSVSKRPSYDPIIYTSVSHHIPCRFYTSTSIFFIYNFVDKECFNCSSCCHCYPFLFYFLDLYVAFSHAATPLPPFVAEKKIFCNFLSVNFSCLIRFPPFFSSTKLDSTPHSLQKMPLHISPNVFES